MSPHYFKAKSQLVLQIYSKQLSAQDVQIDCDISTCSEQSTVDTKQQENGKNIMDYNSTVFNTSIVHITIFLHIHTLLMQHLQVTCTYLQIANVSSGFLAVKWKKSDQASHLCQSLLVPVKCWVISI